MKLVASNRDSGYSLYTVDNTEYRLVVYEQPCKLTFDLDMFGRYTGKLFDVISELYKKELTWAQIQISTGKKNGTWIGENQNDVYPS